MSGFTLYLMRHGAPAIPGRLLGRTDSPATPAGIAACVEQARGLRVEAIVASDLIRASVSAEAIGADLGLPATVDRRWRELDFGAWDGLASDAVDPEALARFWEDADACPPPGGERWSALIGRVSAGIAALPPRPTLVVSHGGAMRAALAALCGFEQRQLWMFALPYAALVSLEIYPGAEVSGRVIGLKS